MPLTAPERDALICKNLRFAGWCARKYAGRGVDIDDLEGEANVGLVMAAARFEPEVHGAKFCTYAGFWIRKRLILAVAAKAAFPDLVPFDADYPGERDPSLELEESTRLALWEAVESLPAKDQVILIRRFGLDGRRPWTIVETSATLRISPHVIRRSTNRSLHAVAKRVKTA